MIYRFLSRIGDGSFIFINVVLRILILNKQCGKRREEEKRERMIIDSTDVQLDINYLLLSRENKEGRSRLEDKV